MANCGERRQMETAIRQGCFLFLCTLASAAPCLAQTTAATQGAAGPTVGAANATASVASGQVELKHSRVYIRVDKARVGHVHAVMGQLASGQLNFRAAEDVQLEPGRLVFDMRSFDADGEAARKYLALEEAVDEGTRKQVNENMLGKSVLDVRTYPTATFACTKITRLATTSHRKLPQYQLQGQFTLHGTTRPVEFTVDVEEVKGWWRVRGAFAILQSDYGIKPFTKAFGVIGVADKLDIYGDLIVAP